MGLPLKSVDLHNKNNSDAQSGQRAKGPAASIKDRSGPRLVVNLDRHHEIDSAHGILNAVLFGAAGWLIIGLLYLAATALF